MTTQEITDVFPGSENASHEIVLNARGQRFGLKLKNGVRSLHILPPQRQPPVVKLEQDSFHLGRGVEVWRQGAYNFYDSANMWTSTPEKLHPAPLMQWYTGFRDAETNMPARGKTHKWVPLYPGGTGDINRRYLAVSFSASASSNRERCFLIIRRKGSPGTLTLEWDADSSGPGTPQKTVTKTTGDAPDLVSYYIEFKPSSVLAVTSGTTYWIKIYGAAADNINNCWEVLCDGAAAGKNSSDNSAWSATTYSPYYRITDEDVAQKIFIFPFNGAWYAVTSRTDRGTSKLYIHGCRGRATAGTSTTLTDTGAGQYGGAWSTNQWSSPFTWKIRIVRGTGQGQVRTIASNTGTVVTVTSAWDITPDTSSEYYIYGGNSWKLVNFGSLTWVSSKPKYSNGIVWFPQGDTTDIVTMGVDYAQTNDHVFYSEGTNHNRAWYLQPTYDSSLGPVMIRANQNATTSGAPNGKAISIARAPTSPSGTPVSIGTDLTYQTSTLIGENTFRITGLYSHQNQLYVAKEDTLYQVSGNVPLETRYGADASPNINNGVAGCSGMDGQFYLAAEHDIFMISGGNSYPMNLPFNLPSNRSGYVLDLASEKGWLFAAVDAGDSGYSSIMRMSLSDRSWHEQVRGFSLGRRIRSVEWLNFPDTRSHLCFEIGGELMFQEMPLFGVRPQQDSGFLYQHEGIIELSTMDLLSTDPKFFSFFALTSKNMAQASTVAVYGREIGIDYQLNDNVGGSTWINAGSFGKSPLDKVYLGKGSQTKIRPRLRIENNDVSNPPVIENFSLSLFSKTKTFNSFYMDVNASNDDDISGEELYDAIVSMVLTADVVEVESIFDFLHNKEVILSVQPNVAIKSMDDGTKWNGTFQLYLEYLPYE